MPIIPNPAATATGLCDTTHTLPGNRSISIGNDIDGLMAFARNAGWLRPLIALANDWAAAIIEDWHAFRDSKLAAWAYTQAGLAKRI